MITFKELISLKTDILESSYVKYVRHKDSRKEYRDLIKDREELLKYQCEQKNDIFNGCDYIVSFFGQESTKALFIGVFKVNGVRKENDKHYYDLTEVEGFEDYKDRVVINWGKATLSWHQWYNKTEKEVIEILPNGYLGHFPGLLNFVLEFSELQKIDKNTEANRQWLNHLKSVNGIYLILDEKTGNQYIGSAYGKLGIWQRWSEYAKNGHGGNKMLKNLCSKDRSYYKNFKFSILQTLPSNSTSKEVITIENLYKTKLGTKAFGLNMN